MAGSDGDSKQGRTEEDAEAFSKVMEERDAKYLAPVERSMAMFKLLKEQHPKLTDWDLTCFSSYWLVTTSYQHPWMRHDAAALAKLITFAHYNMNEAMLPTVLTRDGLEQFMKGMMDEPAKDVTKT